MKSTKIVISAIIFTGMLFISGCESAVQPKTLDKNYGYSYGEINIGSGGVEVLSVDEIVPSKSKLTANLEEAGFIITEYDTALDSDIAAERVYAEKDGAYMDICYGLTDEQAKANFANYEATYEDFYLIAQNEHYVYAVSDEKTFKTAGFETLETNGILFVWK